MFAGMSCFDRVEVMRIQSLNVRCRESNFFTYGFDCSDKTAVLDPLAYHENENSA
jgi:hypothetical protein